MINVISFFRVTERCVVYILYMMINIHVLIIIIGCPYSKKPVSVLLTASQCCTFHGVNIVDRDISLNKLHTTYCLIV